jgi:hypothetical protein
VEIRSGIRAIIFEEQDTGDGRIKVVGAYVEEVDTHPIRHPARKIVQLCASSEVLATKDVYCSQEISL